MVDNQHTTPNDRVVTRGTPICQYERALSAAAQPGMLVVYDTNEYTVKKSDGAGVPYGWLGYEATPLACKPDTPYMEYQSGNVVSVVAGGNFEIFAHVTGDDADTVNIFPGTLLADNGDGTLKVAGSDDRAIAIAQEYKSIAGASAPAVERIHVLSLI